MAVTVGEIVKELIFTVSDLEHYVKGRIVATSEIEGLNFRWDISHHYRPSESAATVYYPSARHAATLDEAEGLLLAYAQNFTTIDVTSNSNY